MPRIDLVRDCARCAALCCVATCFDAGEDFAIDKRAGEPCMHLARDHRCTIHAGLAARGFRGCAAYDCYGAGQRVTALVFSTERERHDAFLALRVVHELLWLLVEAAKICVDEELHLALAAQIACLENVGELDANEADLRAHHRATHALLRRVGTTLKRRLRLSRDQ